MATPGGIYIEAMRELLRPETWWVAWPVGLFVEIGDVLVGGSLYRVSRADRLLGLDGPLEVRPDAQPDAEWQRLSKSGVSVAFKARGETAEGTFAKVGKAEAGALVSFSREGAALLSLADVRIDAVEDQVTLGRQVVEAAQAGTWQTNFMVVTDLVRASAGTILVSQSKHSRVELRAAADVRHLADLSTGVEIALASEDVIYQRNETGLTPFFKVLALRSRRGGGIEPWWGAPYDVYPRFALTRSYRPAMEPVDVASLELEGALTGGVLAAAVEPPALEPESFYPEQEEALRRFGDAGLA